MNEGQLEETESFVDHWWRLLRGPMLPMAGMLAADATSSSAALPSSAVGSGGSGKPDARARSRPAIEAKGGEPLDDSEAVLAAVEAFDKEEAEKAARQYQAWEDWELHRDG